MMALITPTGSQVAFGRFMRAMAATGPDRLVKMRRRGKRTKAIAGRVRRPGK